jgi:mycothiol synthase
MSIVRDVRPGDEATIRAIMNAAFDVDRMPGWTHADIEIALSRLPADPIGTLVATDGGEVVGYWLPRFDDITVHPAHRRRGHGRRLVQAALIRCAERGEPELRLHVAAHLPGSMAFARSLGLAYSSSLWLLRLPRDRPVAVPVIGPDLVRRPWTDDLDVEGFVTFANAAWAGHPTPLGLTTELARLVADLPGFDPEGICLVAMASAPDQPIAFTKVELRALDAGGTKGWIGQIGVLPTHRGRGLGRMLLEWGVTYLRARGAGDVELAVEAANELALGLYRRTGFEPAAEWPHWTRSVSGAKPLTGPGAADQAAARS